jgi:hypothetical protein
MTRLALLPDVHGDRFQGMASARAVGRVRALLAALETSPNP